LSLLSAKNAGHTGLNRITQAVSSTSTWYAFAGQVSNRRTLLMIGRKLGSRPGPALKGYVREHAKQSTVLLPKARQKRSHRNKGWKLYLKAEVEGKL